MKRLIGSAVALIACTFVGSEQALPTRAMPAMAEIPQAAAPRPPLANVDELDVSRLVRKRIDLEVNDPFANAPRVQPAAPTPTPGPEPVAATPTAPPLPYTYLGRMTKGGKAIVYLARNGDMLLAEKGATLDGTYLVEDISSSTIAFVYLPLQARQALSITQTP